MATTLQEDLLKQQVYGNHGGRTPAYTKQPVSSATCWQRTLADTASVRATTLAEHVLQQIVYCIHARTTSIIIVDGKAANTDTQLIPNTGLFSRCCASMDAIDMMFPQVFKK